MKDPNTVASKWNRNIKNATETIKQGVANVKVNPAEEAIKAKDRWWARLEAAKNEGKWEAGLSGRTKEDWQKDMEKGIGRIPAGADAAQPKVVAFMQDFLPYLDAGKSAIDSMPKTTLEEGIAKAEAQIRHNAAFKRKR